MTDLLLAAGSFGVAVALAIERTHVPWWMASAPLVLVSVLYVCSFLDEKTK